jgi:hypothetical protein
MNSCNAVMNRVTSELNATIRTISFLLTVLIRRMDCSRTIMRAPVRTGFLSSVSQ